MSGLLSGDVQMLNPLKASAASSCSYASTLESNAHISTSNQQQMHHLLLNLPLNKDKSKAEVSNSVVLP